jgi:DNA-binding transcriptional ArsR family regulator
MNTEMIWKALRALGDPTRQSIVEFLSRTCCNRATVNEEGEIYGPTAGEVCCHITGAEKVTSTVSQHLHDLEACGLVQIERKGKFMVCTLQTEPLISLSNYLRRLAEETQVHACCGPECCQ